MKKVLSLGLTLIVIMALVVGCSSKPNPTTQSTDTNKEFKLGELTDSKTMVINKDKKEIQILAQVNGKYLTETTRHGVVFKAS